MAENKSKHVPKFSSIDELVEFFETHDLGEYWDQMPEAHFDIDIKRETHIFAIDEDLANRLTEVAKAKRIPSERLINVWLREKLLEQAKEFP
ncbi:MAG: CopG family antitoxin [Anaerolineae bacterium]